MKVLHVDSGTARRGGQVQLDLLRGGMPDDKLCAPRPGADVPFGLLPFLRCIRRWKPDLVAAHTARAHQLALCQPSVPVVVHRRVDFRIRRRAAWKYRAVKGVIAVSHAVRDVVVESGVDPAKVVVVHDGVVPQEGAAGRSGNRRAVVLAVGALVPHKGHRDLLDAMRNVDAELWLVGEGPLEADLRAAAHGRVRFLGSRADVRTLMRQADVFCHCSHEEGLGQVVLEARAAELPIVATRAGGIPEGVGDTAWLVPPRRSDLLAHGLREMLQYRRSPDPLPGVFHADAMRVATRTAYRSFVLGRCPLVGGPSPRYRSPPEAEIP